MDRPGGRKPCYLGNSAPTCGRLSSAVDRTGAITAPRSIRMKKAMTSQPSKTPVQAELSDSDLNAVVGGQRKFQHVEQNGNTYAVGHVLGQTVRVKLT